MKYEVKQVKRYPSEKRADYSKKKAKNTTATPFVIGIPLTIHVGIAGPKYDGFVKKDHSDKTFLPITGEESPKELDKMIEDFANNYVKENYGNVDNGDIKELPESKSEPAAETKKYPADTVPVESVTEQPKKVVPNQTDIMANYYAAQKKKDAEKNKKKKK